MLTLESDRLNVDFGGTGGPRSLGVLELLRFGKSGTFRGSVFHRRCLLKFSLGFCATSWATYSASFRFRFLKLVKENQKEKLSGYHIAVLVPTLYTIE